MSRGLFPALTVLTAFAATAAHAEFSEEWQAVAEEIKAECAAFEETLPPDIGPFPKFVGEPKIPKPPGAPTRPYVCMFVRFDINSGGETQNVGLAFQAPDNLHYRFKRNAISAVKEWRFVVPQEMPEGFSDMYVEIDFDPVEAGSLNIHLKLRNSSR